MEAVYIQEAIKEAKGFGVRINLELIKGRTRVSDVVFQRAVFCLLMRRKGFTLLEIGKYLKRGHPSIIYLIKYGKGNQNKHFRNKFIKIQEKIELKSLDNTQKTIENTPYKADIRAKLVYHTTMANHYANLL